jgi:VanZ family protein
LYIRLIGRNVILQRTLISNRILILKFIKKIIPLLTAGIICLASIAQDSTINAITDTAAHKQAFCTKPGRRLALVTGGHAGFLAGSYILLNKAWYANYPRGSFQTFNDNKEWNQMDKMGHIWTTFHVARASAATWKWAGQSHKKSVLYGSLSALAYQSVIEIQDGFSTQWGFSWGDVAANITGATVFAAQELTWKEQRIQIKLSYWGYNYPPELIGRRNQLFGKSFPERLLKDYNSHTFWASANLTSFFPASRLPKWLNIAVGYGSDGLLGGFENKWTDGDPGFPISRTDIPRIRRFYLSPDIDLTKIKTRSKFLKSVFFVVSTFKIPAPALMLDSKGKFKAYALYY